MEVIDKKNLVEREMYDYYRANRRKVAKGIDQYKLWVKAIHGLMIVLKELVAENENGVYLEGFGYLHIDSSKKMTKRISLLRKKTLDIKKVNFIFDDEKLNKKFTFSMGKKAYLIPEKKEYKSDYETVKYIYNTQKLKWNT